MMRDWELRPTAAAVGMAVGLALFGGCGSICVELWRLHPAAVLGALLGLGLMVWALRNDQGHEGGTSCASTYQRT